MLMVESVNGTPNFSAARAARISPSAHCIPVSPTGAIATGIVTLGPSIVDSVVRATVSSATRCRRLGAARSSFLTRYGPAVKFPHSTQYDAAFGARLVLN